MRNTAAPTFFFVTMLFTLILNYNYVLTRVPAEVTVLSPDLPSIVALGGIN